MEAKKMDSKTEQTAMERLQALLDEYSRDRTYGKGPMINVYTKCHGEAKRWEESGGKWTARLFQALGDAVKESITY
jgi:hypothetical protein